MCLKSMRLIICLILLLAVPLVVPAERLPIRVYTTADGLARDWVLRIVRDSHGFLWFCTSEGLSRFDGYHFTNYNTDQGLPSRVVNYLLETRSGDYWVATNGGLCRFIPDRVAARESKFVSYHLNDNPKVGNVEDLIEDRAGIIWCGTDNGLYRLEQIGGEWRASLVNFQQHPGYPVRFSVRGLMEDRQGALWITTETGLYRRLPDGRTERFGEMEGLPASDFSGRMFEDRDGRIWACGGHGLYQLVSDPQPGKNVVARIWTTKDGLTDNYVNSLFQASDGRLWVATRGGVSELLSEAGPDGLRLRTYTIANGLSNVGIKSMAEDRDGNLWLSSENGAMKLARSGFTNYGEDDGLGGTRISSIFEDQAGKLCVLVGINYKNFVNRFDGRRFDAVELTLPKGITDWGWGWYQTTLQDHTGEWWVPTAQGLVRYPRLDRPEQLTRTRPKAIYTTRDGLPDNQLFRLFEDSRGDIWISSFGYPRVRTMLTRWERATDSFHVYSLPEGIPETVPTAFAEDAAGNLWIGFYTGGVARQEGERFRLFTEADGLPKGFISSLFFDSKQRLWVVTGEGGAARLDKPASEHPQFLVYTTAQGLSSNQVNCVTEDQGGQIYLGTGRGLDRLDPLTGRIKHYTTADGLGNNFINVSYRDRNGTLWFGTLQGLSRLTPQPDIPTAAPPVLISGLRIAGVTAPLSELGAAEVTLHDLQPNQNHLDIDLVGLSFGAGEVLRYQYCLEDENLEWSRPTEQRTIVFANLAPGTYRFLARAISADGTISQTPASVNFRILPPIWKRWWFLTLAGGLLGLVVYSIDRYRIARLIELERVRMRIATDLHDDIGSSLSQISVLGEVVRSYLERDDRVLEPLLKITDLSRDLVDSMGDIIWVANPKKDRLIDLTQRMRRFAGDLFASRNIEFDLRLPDPQQDMRMGAEMRRELFLIFKESINNIVRHSDCKRVEIDLLVGSGRLELSLKDDGKGFDTVRANNGNGLQSMRQRAMKIGGILDILSSEGQGTVVILKAPLGRNTR